MIKILPEDMPDADNWQKEEKQREQREGEEGDGRKGAEES